VDEPIVLEFDELPAYDFLWIEDELGRVVSVSRPEVDGTTLRYDADLEPDMTYELRAGWICPDSPTNAVRTGLRVGFTTSI
jgi:hypothetical protein